MSLEDLDVLNQTDNEFMLKIKTLSPKSGMLTHEPLPDGFKPLSSLTDVDKDT